MLNQRLASFDRRDSIVIMEAADWFRFTCAIYIHQPLRRRRKSDAWYADCGEGSHSYANHPGLSLAGTPGHVSAVRPIVPLK